MESREVFSFQQTELVPHQQASSGNVFLMIWSCVYPEPVDEVIACKQVVDEEFEGMLSCGLVEEENVEGPLIHFLEYNQKTQKLNQETLRDSQPSS